MNKTKNCFIFFFTRKKRTQNPQKPQRWRSLIDEMFE